MKAVPFEFHGRTLPEDIQHSLELYASAGIPPEGFLIAVLCNDLADACAKADDDNLWILPVIVAYIYNHLPMACWRSPEAVEGWIKEFRTSKETKKSLDI